jgi:hypothetical protein
MKKIIVAVIIFLVPLAIATAGEVTITRRLPFNLNDYVNAFSGGIRPMNPNNARIAGEYYRHAVGNEVAKFAQLEGDPNRIDTDIEWLYASYYHVAIRDIRPSEAEVILPANNPREADLKFGFIAFQEMQILRFLGNTAAVGRWEGILKFITDRGNVTRAEVECFYRRGVSGFVSQIVDEQLARIREEYREVNRNVNVSASTLSGIKNAITDFMLAPNATTYRNLLQVYRNHAGDGAIVLGFSVGQLNEEVSSALANNRMLGSW